MRHIQHGDMRHTRVKCFCPKKKMIHALIKRSNECSEQTGNGAGVKIGKESLSGVVGDMEKEVQDTRKESGATGAPELPTAQQPGRAPSRTQTHEIMNAAGMKKENSSSATDSHAKYNKPSKLEAMAFAVEHSPRDWTRFERENDRDTTNYIFFVIMMLIGWCIGWTTV